MVRQRLKCKIFFVQYDKKMLIERENSISIAKIVQCLLKKGNKFSDDLKAEY